MNEAPFHVLVVDDEPVARELTILTLEQLGFECDAATNGKQALQMLDETTYDAVVTDLRMPELHGHALAVELLAQSDRPVIVVVTAVSQPKLARDLFARGVDDVLFKPVDMQLLAVKLSALIQRRRQTAANSV